MGWWVLIYPHPQSEKWFRYCPHDEAVSMCASCLQWPTKSLVKAKIEVFYLPSYSPELNPDERMNANLKHEISSKAPVRTKAKLKEATCNYMSKLEQNSERVRSYFGDPRVAYAA